MEMGNIEDLRNLDFALAMISPSCVFSSSSLLNSICSPQMSKLYADGISQIFDLCHYTKLFAINPEGQFCPKLQVVWHAVSLL